MSFHDQIAEAALRDGNTPDQFRAAAQRHAKAFWFLAILAAAVWFFAGWGWAVVPLGLALVTAFQSVSSTLTARKLKPLMPFAATASIAASLPAEIDLNDVMHVAVIDDIREKYSALLADESQPYSKCMYRPVSILPYPKATVKRALEALLAYVEGRSDSTFLDESIRTPVVADTIRTCLLLLDHFVDLPAAELPTDPLQNAAVGSRLSKA